MSEPQVKRRDRARRTAADVTIPWSIVAGIIQTAGDEMSPTMRRLLEFAPEGFDDPALGAIALAIRRAASDGIIPDTFVVKKLLSADHAATFALLETSREAMTPGHAEFEAETLVKRMESRRVTDTLAAAWQDSKDNPDDARTIARDTVAKLQTLEVEGNHRDIPKARPWLDVCPNESERQHAILVGPGNWFTRGSGAFIVGPTGAGKSTMDATLAFCWAIGHTALGLQPTSSLKSLVIQAEDDDLDLSDMARGIVSALNPNDAERELMRSNVQIVTERAATAERFLELVDSLLREYAPDIVHVNPLSAFFGNDLNDQFCVARFFRNGLNPILAHHAAGFIGIHHVPKPNKDRASWSGSDLAYSGAGSADLANWAREIITLRQTAPGLYEMTPTKRWRKLGWTDDEGRPTQTRLVCHDQTGRMVWHDATPDILESLGSKAYSVKAMVGLVPSAGIDKAELVRLVEETFSVSNRTARSYVADGCRNRKHQLNGKAARCALFAEKSVARREVYPDQPGNRPVVWLTLSTEWRELCA